MRHGKMYFNSPLLSQKYLETQKIFQKQFTLKKCLRLGYNSRLLNPFH